MDKSLNIASISGTTTPHQPMERASLSGQHARPCDRRSTDAREGRAESFCWEPGTEVRWAAGSRKKRKKTKTKTKHPLLHQIRRRRRRLRSSFSFHFPSSFEFKLICSGVLPAARPMGNVECNASALHCGDKSHSRLFEPRWGEGWVDR